MTRPCLILSDADAAHGRIVDALLRVMLMMMMKRGEP
jgi:hypothetical protein